MHHICVQTTVLRVTSGLYNIMQHIHAGSASIWWLEDLSKIAPNEVPNGADVTDVHKELVAGGSSHIARVALLQGAILGGSIFAFKDIDAEVALDGCRKISRLKCPAHPYDIFHEISNTVGQMHLRHKFVLKYLEYITCQQFCDLWWTLEQRHPWTGVV